MAIGTAQLTFSLVVMVGGFFMNLLNIIHGFDSELYNFYESELERQYYSLSFIPDENSISPLCSATMGNVLVNTQHSTPYSNGNFIEKLTAKRVCELFNGEHANVKSLTIEAASRVVFQALVQRGDTVMSLDLRKKEHCNSESLVYHFVNFGLDPKTQHLDYDAIEKSVAENKPKLIVVSPINYPQPIDYERFGKINFGLDPKTQHLDYDAIEKSVAENKPKLIVVSPINYPQPIDYERFGKIASSVGAILWCDISQIAGLVTAGVMPSPLPHADVVTFTTQGALQGPHCSIILCKKRFSSAIDRAAVSSGHSGLGSSELTALAVRLQEMQSIGPHCSIILCKKRFSSAIDRAAVSSGHSGLGSSELTALAVRLQEMQSIEYKNYCKSVVDNARSLGKGLVDGGMRLIGGDTNSHFVIVDTQSCGMSGRGAMDSLADCGIFARSCTIYTADPEVKFDAVRFSSMPATTRGVNIDDMYRLGVLADCGIFARSCTIYTADPEVKFDAVRFSSMPATTRGVNIDDMYRLGVLIGKFLASPTPENEKKLLGLVRDLTLVLPLFHDRWLQKVVKNNLGGNYSFVGNSDSTQSDQSKIARLFKRVTKS